MSAQTLDQAPTTVVVEDDVKYDPEKAAHDELKAPEGDSVLKSHFADWSLEQMIRKFWRMYTFGILVSLAGLYAGYCDSTPGSVVANQGFIKQFGTVINSETGKVELDADHISYWSITQQCVSLVSQFVAPIPADILGRRVFLWLFLLFGAATIALEMAARDWKVWLAAKAMEGVMVGMMPAGPLTLMAEISFPQMRGNVLCYFAVSWCCGGLFAHIGLKALDSVTPMKYLPMIYSEWIFIGIFGVICAFAPESPTWLISKSKMEKAKKNLHYIVGNVEGFDLDHEFAVMVQEVELSQQLVRSQGNSEWRILFKWQNFRRVLTPVLAYAGQNIVGGAYIYSFTSYFFQQAGLKDPFKASLVVSGVSLVGIICSMFTFDRIGRRPLMVWGTFVCILLNFLIGGLSFIPMSESVGGALISMTALWVFTYGISYYTIGWASLVELSTPLLRAKAAGMAAGIHGIGKILWNYTVPQMLSDQKAGWGAKVGLFFGGLSILWFIPIYIYWPETRRRSFAAIDDLYSRGVPPRKFHLVSTSYDSEQFERDAAARRRSNFLLNV